MPLKVGDLKGRAARVVEVDVTSLGDSVMVRVLPVGMWIEASRVSQAAAKALEDTDAADENIDAMVERMQPIAQLLSMCLTDADESVMSFDDAMTLCIDPDGLDGVQLKELAEKIQGANGQEAASGNG